jgi:uncharacterized membrane protein YoaK (UPF0700 family)
LLYLATVVSGVVDASSYLGLGRTFVANMTGNVVFIGFGAAGVAGISVVRSLVALGCFLVGSRLGGVVWRRGGRRRVFLLTSFASETACVGLAYGLTQSHALAPHGSQQLALIAPLAVGLGLQNATATALDQPDLTTTVLTRTLTALASQTRLSRDSLPVVARRLLAVLAIFAGAALGALLVLRVSLQAALLLALGLLSLVTAASFVIEEEQRERAT